MAPNLIRPGGLIWLTLIGLFADVRNAEIISAENDNYIVRVGPNSSDEFPSDFLFGTATAAYQIEGAWNTDGKTPSIWDDLVHDHPELVADHETCDVGADSYHFYEDDIHALKAIGLKVYRFSISWARVLPDGFTPNPLGIRYYNTLIDRLLAEGIEPLVTLYHYDLPRYVQQLGGWTNPLVRDYFRAYADVVFAAYGDRVKRWITVNEPYDFCVDGYGTGNAAPLVHGFDMGAEYLCADNVLKTHAEVYHLYRDKYHARFGGKIGITLSCSFYYPAHPKGDSSDGELVDRAMQFQCGWFAHSIFSKSGYYPPIMVETVVSNSVKEGRLWSRLPEWSEEWRNRVRGSADFIGINYYTSRLVDRAGPASAPKVWDEGASIFKDMDLLKSVNTSWVKSKSSWLYSVPSGIGDLMRWIRDEYDNPEVVITENGWSDDGQMDDTGRIAYLRDNLRELLRAVVDDGCNVTGYTLWSILDNFEWTRGFTEKFGLYRVDRTSPAKTRTAKLSADYFRRVVQTRRVPDQ